MMGGLYHAAYIVDAVGGFLARAVARCAYVHCISPGEYGTYGDVGVLGRSEEFKRDGGWFLYWHDAKLTIP